MADLWMNVGVALAEVPVNIMPLVDDGDFITIEAAVAYDAAGLVLVWNFVTTAGAISQTAVTPTSGGVHDWAHQGNGMYSIEIPDAGGTINNDAEGFGWFTGVATGVLPWRGPVIGFRAAALNDALIDGGDTLDVNVTAMANGTVTAAAVATDAIDADALAADAAQEIATALLDLANGVETGFTLREVLRIMAAVLGGKSSANGNTFRNLGDSKNVIVGTVDASYNRTAVTRDLT